MVDLGLLKSRKVRLPDQTSWNAVQHICPHHGDALLDGNAQSGGRLHDGSGQLDSANSQEEADSETFVMESDAAECVNKVKDQVRKRQRRMSNVAESGEEHSIIWRMFVAATMNAATFMGKNFLDNQNFIMNSKDLTLKKMFDITAKLVGEQEEINNVDKNHWKNHSWKQLSLIGDETVINLQHAKVYVFSDSVLCLGKVHSHPESNETWKKRIGWIITDKRYRDFDGINGEPTEWNIFPGFTTLQLCGKVTDQLSRLVIGRILCRCSTTFLVTRKTMWQMSKSSPYLQRSLELVSGHLMVQVQRRSGLLWKRIVHKEFGIISRTRCCWNSPKADVQFSVQRRCKLKSKGHGKLSIHFTADYPTIESIFLIIVSANQLSLCGAVANICEEFETHQDRSGEPDVLMGQSIVLGEIKEEVPLDNDIPLHQNLLLQRFEERIEMLSQENQVSKFSMDAGFVHVVEIGQYFMTQDTEEQFFAMACREYTLPRSYESSQPKRWIQGNTRIGPVLEITTSYLYGKHGIEIRIRSLSEDNSQSWVRISHG